MRQLTRNKILAPRLLHTVKGIGRSYWIAAGVLTAGVLLSVTCLTASGSTAPIDTEKTDMQGTANTQGIEGPAKPPKLPEPKLPVPKLPVPFGAKRLAPNDDAWLDVKHKQVILDGEVCLRRGMLEMFACIRGSKEHESIVTLDTKAYLAHAALLALGAKTGEPARFTPTYQPASGTEIEVWVEWQEKDGKKRQVQAQEWIRDLSTKKPMTHGWVFAGSGFWTDASTGNRHYEAEGGDFICVSNFPSAMLDLPIKSTQANEGLLFEALTDRIPPVGTPVRVILRPKLPNEKQAAKE